jgi:hypothetical protein
MKLRSCFLKLFIAAWTALLYSRTLNVVCGRRRPSETRFTTGSAGTAAAPAAGLVDD